MRVGRPVIIFALVAGWVAALAVTLGGLIEPMLEWGMQEIEFSWVHESNTLSRVSLEKGGAKRDKTYRMFDYDPPG